MVFYLFRINEMTQKTATQVKCSQKSIGKKQTKAAAAVQRQKLGKKKNCEEAPIKFIDDIELMESIYNIPDETEDLLRPIATSTATKRKNKVKFEQHNDYDSGFDQTMATNVHAITMIEKTTLITSGYDTLIVS